MKKLYIVLWKGSFDTKWSVDAVYENPEIAQARLRLEELEHPTWKHAIVTAEVADE